jgi:hypothetical protein
MGSTLTDCGAGEAEQLLGILDKNASLNNRIGKPLGQEVDEIAVIRRSDVVDRSVRVAGGDPGVVVNPPNGHPR